MSDKIKDFVSTLNIYEKQELVKILTDEIHLNYNQMLSNLDNIDGHVFGMIVNSNQNSLNELTVAQLGRIKNLSSQTKKYK